MAYERFDWDEYIEQVKLDAKELGMEEGRAEGAMDAYNRLEAKMRANGYSEDEISKLMEGLKD